MKTVVIGAGTMGSGIAQIAASHGSGVVLVDQHEEVLKRSKDKLEKILSRLIEKGRIDENTKREIQGNIEYQTNMDGISDADLVIEAIVENLEIKQHLFREVESKVNENCIIASNTSSLSITSLAAVLSSPERCIGLHFFNPAPLMKLVEIIPALHTSNDIVSQSIAIIESWGKLAVSVKDTPGFIVNRVARPFYSESLRIYEEGICDKEGIDWAMKHVANFRMGPFELMDFIGHDVNYAVTESMYNSYHQEPRYKPSFTQQRLVEAGWLGRKSGKGFYNYTDGDLTSNKPDEQLAETVAHRVVLMLINEAADAAYYRIASIQDIDLAMTKGVNYPKGLLQWADDMGLEKVVHGLDSLFDHYHEERYRCSPLLRNMLKEGKSFYA